MSAERWDDVQAMHQVKSPRDFIADRVGDAGGKLGELGPAKAGTLHAR